MLSPANPAAAQQFGALSISFLLTSIYLHKLCWVLQVLISLYDAPPYLPMAGAVQPFSWNSKNLEPHWLHQFSEFLWLV